MSMSEQSIRPSLRSRFDVQSSCEWTDADLSAMLRHQLSSGLNPGEATIAEILAGGSAGPLEMLKRAAKVNRARGDSGLPADLWRVLYFASIAAARRAGHSISELPDDELLRGFEWTAARTWVDEPIKSMMLNACSSMKRSST